ncbi:MAG: iron export ABC transporter permease subunit FetB [Polyangiales bacterium]
MNPVLIPFHRLALSLGLVALSIALSRRWSLGIERDLGLGAVRAAVQLIAIGYVLLVLFEHQRPLLVMLSLAVMLTIASVTASRRVEHGPPSRVLLPRAFAAIGAGALVALLPVFAWIVPPSPWFEARYLVPIGGMMLSNAMNTVAQVFERVFAQSSSESATVEQWLALGATPRQALASITRAALRAAMIPTINALVTVGLVALPGMMTGQILSGAAPEQAVRYQLVVMYQLVAVAAVSGSIAAWFARRLLFTEQAQLRAAWTRAKGA